jgi:hypothetical protein
MTNWSKRVSDMTDEEMQLEIRYLRSALTNLRRHHFKLRARVMAQAYAIEADGRVPGLIAIAPGYRIVKDDELPEYAKGIRGGAL